ncbi:DUF861 domain-containing protein [Permianibacter sp. IMCC34836]|uniref:cupin domain-containing protein n=1 Tax=Permianibacter fluminis TaxID=2738515 RepID=UPI001551E77E|nr:cupin domain-containing protein [Permianibacter fluminis]NQD37102.1 DUF861 domain-containing protein [Permianibacter fluminis]
MSQQNQAVLMFAAARSSVQAFLPAAEKVLAGTPEQTVANHYSDDTGQFHAGEWTGEPGTWRVSYTEHEFCYVTRGRIAITDAAGVQTTVGAGDAFIIPAGFKGVWQVVESAHKYYVIFEPK